MMAIWPVGPPKLMKPSLTQKRKASVKVGRVPMPVSEPHAVTLVKQCNGYYTMRVKWLFLVHQLQSPLSRERVMVWRAVQKTGAVLYRNSVYALPHSSERLEDFQWLCQQIRDAKGEASVFVSEASDRKEDAALHALFVQRAEANYAAVLADAERLQTRVKRAKSDRRLSERLLRTLAMEAQQLAVALTEAQRTDFFDA